MILRSRGVHPSHLVPECLDILLHEPTVIHCPEQNPALPLTLSLPAVSAALWTTTGWHSSSRRSSGWSKKRRKLDVAVPNGVSPFLLGHDVIEPFLWGRELALRPTRSNFPSRGAGLFRYDRRSGRGHCGEQWWDKRGV